MQRRFVSGLVLLALAALLWAAMTAAGDRQRTLVINTGLLVAGVLALAMPLGVALAFLLARTDLPGRRLFGLLLLMQLFVPLYLQTSAWQAGFGLQGWYTQIFGGAAAPWLEGWRGAIWVHSLAAVPWIVLIVGLGLRQVEPELEEDALLDASARRVIARVTLRRAAGSIQLAALWTAVTVASEMTVTDLYRVRTYAEELYTTYAVEEDPDQAQLATLPGLIVLSCLLIATLWGWSRLLAADVLPTPRLARRFALGRWQWPGLMLAALSVLLIVIVPLVNLLVMAGKFSVRGAEGIERHYSLVQAWQAVVESPSRHSEAFLGSLEIGLPAATITTLLAGILAWWARPGGLRALLPLGIAAACLAAPGTTLGIWLIRTCNDPRWPWLNWLYDDRIALPCLVQIVRALPLATLVIWQAVRNIPRGVLEAATLDGAGPVWRLLKIGLPLTWPAIVAAWLVALVVAVGELPGTMLMLRPGMLTLSFKINELLHYGVDRQLAGICLTEAGGFFIASGLLILTGNWYFRRSRQTFTNH